MFFFGGGWERWFELLGAKCVTVAVYRFGGIEYGDSRFVVRNEQERVRCYGNMSFTWLWNRSMGSTCTKHLNSW